LWECIHQGSYRQALNKPAKLCTLSQALQSLPAQRRLYFQFVTCFVLSEIVMQYTLFVTLMF